MRPAVGRLPVRTVEVHGMQLRILQHFFDTPVAQPRGIPRRADLTGMKVWPTAHRMLRRMDETVLEQLRRAAAERARPLRVLELGSGTGIAGLGVALRLGRAASVVLTDPELAVNYAEAEAGTSLDLLRANVALNQPALEAAGAQVEARALEWADAAHARELRRACLPEGGEFDLVLGSELLYDSDHYAPLLAVLAAFVRSEATVAVLGYTHRSGSEARFLKQAAERFAVETEEFPRSEASAPWALSTLRYAPPPPPQTRESDRCGQQAGGARRRGYCSAAGPAPTAEQIDRMIAPPLHLTPHEQLELARSDDEQRGRRPLSLPAANSKGEVDYTSWGDYLLGRGWGEDNDLTDRLLVQSITGALSCPLTAYASCVLFGLDTRESLCLHVVGAASSNEGALLRSGWAWEELSALLPYTEVHLCLVGPALLEATGEMQQLTNQLTVECHAVDYVAWRTRRTSRAEVPAPDAVICFNSGCGTDEDAWGGAMDLILNERSPLVCTSFDEMDAEKDDRFLVARGAHFTRSTERNSFASTLPELRTGRQGEAVLSIAQRYGIELPPRIGYSNALWRAIQGKD